MALMWTPLPTMLSVRIVAYCLSAVQVVMICAPRIASCAVLQAVNPMPRPERLRISFGRRGGVDVVKPQLADAADRAHRQGLKLGLRAIADHRHGRGALGRQMARDHGACRGGAQRGQQRHLGQKFTG
jgi:hypothetical protein